jgi:hypothetical protein
LEILLPITFPTAMLGEPAIVARTLTTNSGMEVPKPAMTMPTNNGDRRRRSPSATAPRTNASPPMSRKISPQTNRTAVIQCPTPLLGLTPKFTGLLSHPVGKLS